MTPTKPIRMWAVTRDGEIYAVHTTRENARFDAYLEQTSSEGHRWAVIRVLVAPIKKQERR